MAARSGNRSKHRRSVPTTLGKAPPNPNSEFIDLSHLRKPIDTSLFGLSQILSLFETATDEVRRYVAYECELMFECRVCRTVFRSLANFILHKRNYCQEFFSSISDNNKTDFEDNELTVIDKDNLLSSANDKIKNIETTPRRYPKRNLSLVLQKLSDQQDCQKIVENIANVELTEEKEIIEGSPPSKTLCLEAVDNNKEGVFQTMNCKQIGNDLMKSEVMEIHSILNTNEAILGPDGKVFSFRTEVNDTGGQKLTCTICNLKFATIKTLSQHIKYKHNENRIVYLCPECKDSFANPWCVFRHLYTIHQKTTAQIRRMRDQVHLSAIAKKHEVTHKKASGSTEGKNDDTQSSNPHQDFESQCCEGCGKRFDRRAALNSHIQGCLKRIAASNVIKEKEKESQGLINKQSIDAVKGSRRRKPEILQRIRKNYNLEVILENEEVLCENEEVPCENEEVPCENKEVPCENKEVPCENEEVPCENEETHVEDRSNVKQTIECIDTHNDSAVNRNDTSYTEEQIVNKDNNTNVKDITYQKRLIQEVIFGNSNPAIEDGLSKAPSTDQYIGLVSDEEEVLGFVKQSDILIKDKLTDKNIRHIEHSISLTKDNMTDKKIETIKEVISSIEQTEDRKEKSDYIEKYVKQNKTTATDIEMESTNTYDPVSRGFEIQNLVDPAIEVIEIPHENSTLPQDDVLENIHDRFTEVQGIIEEDPIEIITIDVNDDEEEDVANKNIAAEEVNILPKISILRQYGSKKAKTRNLDKVIELSNEEIVDSNVHINNNINTTNIGLSSEIESTDIAIAAEYDVTEVINISESEESESCSCFDDKSNDSCSSYGSKRNLGTNVNTRVNKLDKALIHNKNYGTTEQHLENKKHCRKRKNSTEIQSEDSNYTLVDKCNDYVDWNRVMCHPCSKIFSAESELLKHMALHFNWLQYQCNMCNFISYEKKTCMQHVTEHDINIDTINNVIVPLPHWKTLCMATPFNNNIEDPTTGNNKSDNTIENTNNSEISDNTDEDISQDDTSLTCSASKIKTQDPSLRKMIMEVIFGSEQNVIKHSSVSNLKTRPIRNRVSVKTLQKDFEYDMKQIDSKVKKAPVDIKVKPIKIVKNTEEDFCVVSSNVSPSIHKKKRTY